MRFLEQADPHDRPTAAEQAAEARAHGACEECGSVRCRCGETVPNAVQAEGATWQTEAWSDACGCDLCDLPTERRCSTYDGVWWHYRYLCAPCFARWTGESEAAR
jgi:hypothetical protein